MHEYVSLLIDIEKSRKYKIDERNEIQNYMTYCVERLNELFGENIERSITFSGGDELQGLFKDTTTAILYFRLFEILLNPVKVRAGIGIGEWTVKVKDGLSTQQDGPAYHRARKAIEDVYRRQLQNIKIYSGRDDVMANHLINSSISLKRQQIHMQNIVLTILELVYPFITISAKNEPWYKEKIVKELLLAKFNYKLGAKTAGFSDKIETISEKGIFNIAKVPVPNPIIINGDILELEDVIIKKNTATTISEILGCSRQNVDSIIKRGNGNKIRELDFMALQYIDKIYR